MPNSSDSPSMRKFAFSWISGSHSNRAVITSPRRIAGICSTRPISAISVVVPQAVAATLRPDRISRPGSRAPMKGSRAMRAGDMCPGLPVGAYDLFAA